MQEGRLNEERGKEIEVATKVMSPSNPFSIDVANNNDVTKQVCVRGGGVAAQRTLCGVLGDEGVVDGEGGGKRGASSRRGTSSQHQRRCSTTLAHCNTLQHAATHCDALQRTAPHRRRSASPTQYSTLQHPATPCNALQRPATPCNARYHIEKIARRRVAAAPDMGVLLVCVAVCGAACVAVCAVVCV